MASTEPSTELSIGTRGSALALAQARLVARRWSGRRRRVELVDRRDGGRPARAGHRVGRGRVRGRHRAGAARRTRRRRRPQRQGRADRRGRAARDRRVPAARGSARRAGRARGRARAIASPTCRRARASAPTARDGPASCWPGGRTWSSTRSTATSTRACGGSTRARPTRSCSPWPASIDSGRATGSRSGSTPELVPPAPGQGAIAVQVRRRRRARCAAVARRRRPPTRGGGRGRARVPRRSGGGCRAPIGALATIWTGVLELLAGTPARTGRTASMTRAGARDAAMAGTCVGLVAGPGSRTARPRRRRAPRVLVTRASGQARRLASALRDAGARSRGGPGHRDRAGAPAPSSTSALARSAGYDWVVVTSANGARADHRGGRARRDSLGGPPMGGRRAAHRGALSRRASTSTSCRAAGRRGDRSAASCPSSAGRARPLLAATSLAPSAGGAAFPRRDRRRGRGVSDLEAPARRGPAACSHGGGLVDAVVFASGSAVRGLLRSRRRHRRPRSIPAVCIGPETAPRPRASRVPRARGRVRAGR